MQRKLTPELISSYTKLDDHGRNVLAGFAENFSDCTIDWISTEEMEKRKEGLIPANGMTNEISAELIITTKKGKQKSRVVSTQPRLFPKEDKSL